MKHVPPQFYRNLRAVALLALSPESCGDKKGCGYSATCASCEYTSLRLLIEMWNTEVRSTEDEIGSQAADRSWLASSFATFQGSTTIDQICSIRRRYRYSERVQKTCR